VSLATPCSLQSAAVGEPLAGTAPVARGWVIVEQSGPWGRDVLVDSPLPEPAKQQLRLLKDEGFGVLLARAARGQVRPMTGGHHIFVASSAVGDSVLREAVVDDLRELSGLDAEGLMGSGFGSPAQLPALFVCTHSRRDACCAVHGRALVSGLIERAPAGLQERIWECSHIGGHRFAPVTLSLPWGVVHGRCSLDDALEVVGRLTSGRVLIEHLRGRSSVPPAAQAAEIAVRRVTGEDQVDALDAVVVRDLGDDVDVSVRHVDGRTWHVSVARREDDVLRAESCGKDPLPVQSWAVTDLQSGVP
jgi:hypothetical protein